MLPRKLTTAMLLLVSAGQGPEPASRSLQQSVCVSVEGTLAPCSGAVPTRPDCFATRRAADLKQRMIDREDLLAVLNRSFLPCSPVALSCMFARAGRLCPVAAAGQLFDLPPTDAFLTVCSRCQAGTRGVAQGPTCHDVSATGCVVDARLLCCCLVRSTLARCPRCSSALEPAIDAVIRVWHKSSARAACQLLTALLTPLCCYGPAYAAAASSCAFARSGSSCAFARSGLAVSDPGSLSWGVLRACYMCARLVLTRRAARADFANSWS
jgi:hypothetical protein